MPGGTFRERRGRLAVFVSANVRYINSELSLISYLTQAATISTTHLIYIMSGPNSHYLKCEDTQLEALMTTYPSPKGEQLNVGFLRKEMGAMFPLPGTLGE